MLLKVGVVGVGHLGSLHARIYNELKDVELTAVVDVDREKAGEIGRSYGVPAFTDFREIFDRVDAVSIAVPTVQHYEIAAEFLDRGIPTLVEKPLAKTIAQGEELVRKARANNTLLQVGHVERFNPAVMAAQKHISDPRFIECHRLAPFKFRSVDIDVVMDLMIHDIDIILHLVHSPLKQVDAVGVALLFGREDIANARLEFENGCVANVTASRISDKAMRKIRIFSRDAYYSIDTLDRQAMMYRRSKDFPAGLKLSEVPTPEELARIPRNLYTVENLNVQTGEPLVKELESFVHAVRQRTTPIVTGEHGVRAMQVADQILKAIRKHAGK